MRSRSALACSKSLMARSCSSVAFFRAASSIFLWASSILCCASRSFLAARSAGSCGSGGCCCWSLFSSSAGEPGLPCEGGESDGGVLLGFDGLPSDGFPSLGFDFEGCGLPLAGGLPGFDLSDLSLDFGALWSDFDDSSDLPLDSFCLSSDFGLSLFSDLGSGFSSGLDFSLPAGLGSTLLGDGFSLAGVLSPSVL